MRWRDPDGRIRRCRSPLPWSWCSMRATTTAPAWPGDSVRTCTSSRSMSAMSALRVRPASATRSRGSDVRRRTDLVRHHRRRHRSGQRLAGAPTRQRVLTWSWASCGWGSGGTTPRKPPNSTRLAIVLRATRHHQHIHGANMGFRVRGVLARRRLPSRWPAAKMSTWSSDFGPAGSRVYSGRATYGSPPPTVGTAGPPAALPITSRRLA